MKTPKIMSIVIMFIFLTSACAGGSPNSPQIQVQNPWARSAGGMEMTGQAGTPAAGMGMQGVNGAAYMLLVNKGGVSDRLLRAESDVAQAVELHESKMEGGVMKMNPVQFIEIPANGQAELKPGGLHIMLISLKRELKPGEMITITLFFEKSGSMTIQAEVKAM